MPIVKMPDGTLVRFPDDMPREQIRDMIASKFPEVVPQHSNGSGYGQQAFSGLLEGATGALGAPVDLVNNFLVKPAVSGVNALLGTNLKASESPLGGAAGLRQGLAISPESQEKGVQIARRVAQSVGGAAVPAAGTARTMGQVAAQLATGFGGGVGGAAAQQLAPGNIGAEIAGDLIGGLATGGTIAGLANRSARKSAEKAVPTVEQLKEQASGLYQKAEKNGVTATQQQTKNLADEFRGIAEREGLIYPDGQVSASYPKAAEALRMTNAYSKGEMNPTQMQVVRDTLSDAAYTTEGKESRIATQMLKKFDEFTAPLAPEFPQARQISQRYLKGEKLEKLRELAKNASNNYTQSGFDNALRQQYRGLSDRIIKGQEGGWSPEQIAAINRVANGTPVSRLATWAGKAAPKGVVSTGASVGLPFYIGNAFGGPQVGILASLGTAGGGFAAQTAASNMRSRYGLLAELMARNGGPVAAQNNPELLGGILGALMASQAASQSD
ncbi:hypothetical protein ACFOLL_04365 [Falsochrobactrum ovis]|uniref:Uncharacterized protein n=1 Tax=Falsochrobactrum ovis TaxID=1293442 RepID=A0A364JVL0_9HYPH|nr:hypothetical protein [Falsochrobactrum ovis]RAK29155.1 hypothetical protein C7374_105206 [Falsochrobactrum ovis]